MCRVSPYKSQTCNHRWFALIQPCIPGISFRTAPPGHYFDRPRTLLGGTVWHPAPPGSCPDCDLRGRYDGDQVRLYLGKGGVGERQGNSGCWGPYGNGFWPGTQGGIHTSGYSSVYGYRHGYRYSNGSRYGSGYGYVPGKLAVRGSGGYNWRGDYIGNPYAIRRVEGGGCFGCFGL